MGVLVERNVESKARDGTILRADVYRPSAAGRYPVLLQRTPYNKEFLPLTALTLDPVRAAEAGYVVVVQDVRGRWASDGDVFEPYATEAEDGHDAVEWAAGVPGSNGVVGAYGISYTGLAAWLAAQTAPPSLRALAASQAPGGAHRLWRDGALRWGTVVSWSLATIGPGALIRAKRRSPEFAGELLRLVDDIDAFDERVLHLPIGSFPPARPGDATFLPFFFRALEAGAEAEAAAEASRDPHASVRVPALVLAGWHDAYLAADLRHFRAMRASAATAQARRQTRLVVGPWAHATFHHVVGDLDFGYRADGIWLDLRGDLTELQLRWFDRRLKGLDTGIDEEPPVKIFVQGPNRWRFEDDWPLARAAPTPWHLGPAGRLSPGKPGAGGGFDSFVYDPRDPCPTRGGGFLMPGTYPAGPVDQGPILSRPDVLAYTSDPLPEDMEVTGPVSAVLYAATSARDTDWVVKLCDVSPDDHTVNVCDGILRARYRRGLDAPVIVEPDTVERYEIDLWATSWVFRAGHRLRVLVTSSDFPRYDRNPNTGERGVDATSSVPAKQRIFHDATRASRVLLPVVP